MKLNKNNLYNIIKNESITYDANIKISESKDKDKDKGKKIDVLNIEKIYYLYFSKSVCKVIKLI